MIIIVLLGEPAVPTSEDAEAAGSDEGEDGPQEDFRHDANAEQRIPPDPPEETGMVRVIIKVVVIVGHFYSLGVFVIRDEIVINPIRISKSSRANHWHIILIMITRRVSSASNTDFFDEIEQ